MTRYGTQAPFLTQLERNQMALRLRALGANRTELVLDNGPIVFFSYDTPVAAHIPGRGYVRTEQPYSRTTSKHIGLWLAAHDTRLSIFAVPTEPQSFFDALC